MQAKVEPTLWVLKMVNDQKPQSVSQVGGTDRKPRKLSVKTSFQPFGSIHGYQSPGTSLGARVSLSERPLQVRTSEMGQEFEKETSKS